MKDLFSHVRRQTPPAERIADAEGVLDVVTAVLVFHPGHRTMDDQKTCHAEGVVEADCVALDLDVAVIGRTDDLATVVWLEPSRPMPLVDACGVDLTQTISGSMLEREASIGF
jgi:hypothetical protein